jgi:hypothetical protein
VLALLVAGVSAELWKWHRRLVHLSFDLLSRLSGLGFVRGLPKLKYQKDLVCAPCRHGKMVAASRLPLTSIMQRGHASCSIWTWLVQLMCARRMVNGMSL